MAPSPPGPDVGYRPQLKLHKLTFEDHPGLEVTVRAPTVDGYLKLTGLSSALTGDRPDPSKAAEMFERLAAHLVSWNVEDEQGNPVPVTFDGVSTQELGFILQIVTGWVSAIADVAPPLPPGSSGGATSPEASLALASSSVNLPN